jgi:tyrosine-protein kinase Etk/Wzc
MDGNRDSEAPGRARVSADPAAAAAPMAPIPGPELPDDEIDVSRILILLWKSKVTIGLGLLLGLVAGLFIYASTPPTFQADALLQLEEKSGELGLPSSLSGMLESDPRSVTEIEILRSRMVLGQAVADQKLDWRVFPVLAPVVGTVILRYRLPMLDRVLPDHFVRAGENLTLDDLVVPPRWVNQDILVTVTGPDRFEVTTPLATVLDGRVGVPLVLPDPGFSVTIAELDAPPGRQFMLRQVDENAAVAALRQRLTVVERGRASGILEVRLVGEQRGQATRTLDAIVRAYVGQNVARSAAEAESSLAFIREQLPQAEENLRKAESALNAYRQQQTSVDLSLETQMVLGQITAVEAELAELERREEEIKQRFTPSHPTYRLLIEERQLIETKLARLREEVGQLPETQRQVVNLTRDVELAQRLHLELLTRLQGVEVLRASTIGSVRVIDNAASRSQAIAPQRNRILGLGLLLGGLLGAAVALLREWLRRRIQDIAELERLGPPVLATINYSRTADTQGRRRGRLGILAVESPSDLTVEAFRSLRTSLHFGMLDARTPTLMITSTHPDAGKSFLAANLAAVAAQGGQRVCLIDADMRRGQLRRYFDRPRNAAGLAEVLAGDVRIEDAITPGPVDGLSFLASGRYPPNPSELLMRAEFSRLVDWCAQHHDLTIFDTPPVLAVTDPVILGRGVGASILVVRHDRTPPAEVNAALRSLASGGVRVSGSVMNGFDPRRARSGYSYSYGYRYDYRRRNN